METIIPAIKQMEQKSEANQYFKKISTEDGDVPFLKDIWSFFGTKGIKTQFLTVNPDTSFKVDLEVCESLGCPIRIVTDKDSVEEKWNILRETVKTRKIADEHKDKAWLQGIEKKWILPKNIQLKKTALTWTTLKQEVEQGTEARIDLLKIEAHNEEEQALLYSMLNSGFRPGILLVRYTEDPDANVPSMLIAGHLQMSGYKLGDVVGNWFLYIYTDICLYDSCSWRNTKDQNPVVKYLVELFDEKAKVSSKASEPTDIQTK